MWPIPHRPLLSFPTRRSSDLEDDYEALRDFTHSYEGSTTPMEAMHLEYQRLHRGRGSFVGVREVRSEEHTSELQSRGHLVCRLLRAKHKRSKRIQRRYR